MLALRRSTKHSEKKAARQYSRGQKTLNLNVGDLISVRVFTLKNNIEIYHPY